jgi:Flp pilus assembly protein TadB
MADRAANRTHKSPTMGLHPGEQRILRRIEEHLRTKDLDLDAFLSGRSALRRPRVLLGAMYLVPPVFIALGLVLHIIVLVVVGVVAAPLVPVAVWLLIRRGSAPSRHSQLPATVTQPPTDNHLEDSLRARPHCAVAQRCWRS